MIGEEVAWLYRILGQRGLIAGSSGNVSARTPEGMCITPSGGDPDWVREGDLAQVTLDGQTYPATSGATPSSATPSSEWAMHAAVYRTCHQARFIAHTHADACTALACLNRPLPKRE